MKDIQDALARVGKSLAEIAQVVVNAMDNLTPEQRAVIEFLAENPEIAEAFQELNQKLARQRAIGGATKEAARPSEPLIKDERIRKIIRAWASENDSTSVVYYSPKNELADSYGNSISFNLIFRELNHGAEYTIAELCGEEEE